MCYLIFGNFHKQSIVKQLSRAVETETWIHKEGTQRKTWCALGPWLPRYHEKIGHDILLGF